MFSPKIELNQFFMFCKKFCFMLNHKGWKNSQFGFNYDCFLLLMRYMKNLQSQVVLDWRLYSWQTPKKNIICQGAPRKNICHAYQILAVRLRGLGEGCWVNPLKKICDENLFFQIILYEALKMSGKLYLLMYNLT